MKIDREMLNHCEQDRTFEQLVRSAKKIEITSENIFETCLPGGGSAGGCYAFAGNGTNRQFLSLDLDLSQTRQFLIPSSEISTLRVDKSHMGCRLSLLLQVWPTQGRRQVVKRRQQSDKRATQANKKE